MRAYHIAHVLGGLTALQSPSAPQGLWRGWAVPARPVAATAVGVRGYSYVYSLYGSVVVRGGSAGQWSCSWPQTHIIIVYNDFYRMSGEAMATVVPPCKARKPPCAVRGESGPLWGHWTPPVRPPRLASWCESGSRPDHAPKPGRPATRWHVRRLVVRQGHGMIPPWTAADYADAPVLRP